MPKEFNRKKDFSRPSKSSFRSNDKSADKEKSGDKKYSSRGTDSRPKFSGDKSEKSERKPFSKDFKPREKKEYGERKDSGSDRPKRSFGSDRPVRKTYGDDSKTREKKEYGERKDPSSDRPKRSYGSDRPERKPYSDDFKPREKREDGESKSWSSNRDKKPFSKEFKPREKREKTEDEILGNNRPIKKFDQNGSKYSPKNFSQKSDDDSTSSENKFNSKTEKPRRARVSSVRKKSDDEGDLSFGTVRLNKFIANAGICSRREADVLIETGVITVNGKVVTELGYKVGATDIVAYGGQGIRREKNVYILLNKPKDYITTADDPMERKTVMHLIKGACKERVYPVGRFDRNSTGLLIMTN